MSSRDDIPPGVREDVAARDRYRCRWCGRTSPSWAGFHIHHIIYRSQGGPHELWNLIVLCHLCHAQVHSEGPDKCREVLFELTERSGVTGLQLRRWKQRTERKQSS